jgi:hypothetical protein
MSKTLQFRRDTTANLSSVTGSVGEIFIDTTKDTVVVMDGSTSGGFPLQKELVSGTSIKTINTNSILGSGDISISGYTGSAGAGYTGSAGAGYTGSAGTNGFTGSQGDIGYTGSAGAGYTGSAGATGYTGSAGSGGEITVQDEGTPLATAATTLNFVGSGVVASGTGSTKTITISGGGGAADLSAVAEDILPAFDEVYDIGSTTNKWYDGYFTNSVNLDTISLTNSSGTLAINSDVTVGSLLVDQLLLSENTITADASTALQYLGDKGIVEINNSNLDVREGDWIGVPVVETVDSIPPLTTGAEGIIRYNKDESRFEGYNSEGWASLGGLETNAAGDNIITGNLVVSGDITSSSDETLKDNIKSIESALDIVTKLSGKLYTMKSDETQKEKIGFIAQEIEQHLPQVVSTDPNGIKSVSYGNVTALLVEAIKELNQKIENLKK